MARPDRHGSYRGNLLLLAASLLLTGLLVAFAEGALRVAGLGAPDAAGTSRLKYQQLYLPILDPALRLDGIRVLRPADRRLPYQTILQEKPPGALRVFVFGGSATAGLGFSPNVTFARHLEQMLERAYPGRIVEVMNLGIVALASKQVKTLVADACRNHDVDLLIVYSGNNEFLQIHAEKYFALRRGWLAGILDLVSRTHLYRFVDHTIRGKPQRPSAPEQDFSKEDLRLTEHAIIQEIEVTAEEIEGILADYEANLEEMVMAASSTRTPVILMTVASNWKWRGRHDLPADWLDELIGPGSPHAAERYRPVRAALAKKLEASPPREAHEWLFRRAVAAEALGDFEAARSDYRAAMNQDPHLRRALDAMGDRVRRVANRHRVALVDTIDLLSGHAEHGIIGFDEFYDYVHFSPRGAILVAVELFRTMLRMGTIEQPDPFDPGEYYRERTERLAQLERDELDVEEWMGFSFEPALINDRDLWKYDRMLRDLDRRLDANPNDVLALVYRGNANYFRIDGAADAEADYLAALALDGDQTAVQANLEQLRREGRP